VFTHGSRFQGDNRAKWIIAVVILCGVALYFLASNYSSTIPSYVQFEADFSKEEMGRFYARTREDLYRAVWHDVCASLKNRQFKSALARLSNGMGRIDGVIADVNGNVMACIRFRDGQSMWITLSKNRPRQARLGPQRQL
jgi:hypothetical protein